MDSPTAGTEGLVVVPQTFLRRRPASAASASSASAPAHSDATTVDQRDLRTDARPRLRLRSSAWMVLSAGQGRGVLPSLPWWHSVVTATRPCRSGS